MSMFDIAYQTKTKPRQFKLKVILVYSVSYKQKMSSTERKEPEPAASVQQAVTELQDDDEFCDFPEDGKYITDLHELRTSQSLKASTTILTLLRSKY
ncbi:hypothetical protein B5S33_g695 [[Candida] boidinii]|nr:hypothetical protein B5S30_g88 [[Candida] boidinii]OWB82074.1 hypothetical protein B5S33_g695 [[Candida] boidinii]